MKPMPTALAGRRILVVEDDYFIADDLRRQFEASGAEVLGPVATVEDALALIASTPRIDGAVLDVNLRDVMVYPVADLLQARAVPFVFATGIEKAAIPARHSGARYCAKPFEVVQIARVLFA